MRACNTGLSHCKTVRNRGLHGSSGPGKLYMKARLGHCSHVTRRREPDAENSSETTPDLGAEDIFATDAVGAIVDALAMLMTIGAEFETADRLNGTIP